MTTVYTQDNAGAAALEFARQLSGYPYVYGGTWPGSGGTDCDGLWNYGYGRVGVIVRRPTYLGYLDSPFDQRNGHASDPHEAGDLLWIPGADPGPNGEPGHVMGYVSPGLVFQAEETGTNIGQFPYDTTQWQYRTRPALQLEAAEMKVLVGSAAWKVPAKYRPRGVLPALTPNEPNDEAAVIFLRRCLRAAGYWPTLWPLHLDGFIVGPKGNGFGTRTQNRTIAFKRDHGLHANAIVGPHTWAKLGVVA